jgi:isoprenylcysteine carboxyl methyltransferase (ICMT) family protein YpbQ
MTQYQKDFIKSIAFILLWFTLDMFLFNQRLYKDYTDAENLISTIGTLLMMFISVVLYWVIKIYHKGDKK